VLADIDRHRHQILEHHTRRTRRQAIDLSQHEAPPEVSGGRRA
jgi:hypothetical protein